VIRAGQTWNYRGLQLYWYAVDEWSDATGLVWATTDPVYCIASILVSDGEYSFGLSRKHSLAADESEALHAYLRSLGLKEMSVGCTKKRQT